MWTPPARTIKLTPASAQGLRNAIRNAHRIAMRVRGAVFTLGDLPRLSRKDADALRQAAISVYKYIPVSMVPLADAQIWVDSANWGAASPPVLDDDDRLGWPTFANEAVLLRAVDVLAPRPRSAPGRPPANLSLAALTPKALNTDPGLLRPRAFGGRSEDEPCRDSCNERDARAWRYAANRWATLVALLRPYMVGTFGPNVANWPKIGGGLVEADEPFNKMNQTLASAASKLDTGTIDTYVAAQKNARLAYASWQELLRQKTGKRVTGKLITLAETDVGRWGPIQAAGNRTEGEPCTGLLDTCGDKDVYAWEVMATGWNKTASQLREAVVIAFGSDTSEWPPIVRAGELAYSEAQALFQADIGWSDWEKVQAFMDIQALLKDGMELWAQAIEAKSGVEVKHNTYDANKDTDAVIPPPSLPSLPSLPTFSTRGLLIGGAVALGVLGTVGYLFFRKKK